MDPILFGGAVAFEGSAWGSLVRLCGGGGSVAVRFSVLDVGNGFQLTALLRHGEDAVLEPLGAVTEPVPRVAAPEFVFLEGAVEGLGPEIENGEV